MTQQDQTPPKYGPVGGISDETGIGDKTPLRWYQFLRLVVFALVVAGLLWLQWGSIQMHEKLAAILPPVGDLMPDRAGRMILGIAFMVAVFAVWTATWAVFPLTDQPLRIRLRSFLERSAIFCVYGVILLAGEASGVSDALRAVPLIGLYQLASLCLLLFLFRFRSTNRQRDSAKNAIINTGLNGRLKNGEEQEPR